MIKALIGNGGHAREVMAQMNQRLIRFVDDEYWNDGDDMLLPLSSFNPEVYEVMIAVGSSDDRLNISKKLPKETKYFSFIHNTVLVLDDSIQIGDGTFIGAYSVLTTNIRVGRHSLLNRSNHIGHDCKIGDYLTLMPGAIVSGDCNINDNVYVGTNSSIREKLSICSNVIIGLNSGVVSNINESGVYVGTPAKKIK